jgi:hypothetical protein
MIPNSTTLTPFETPMDGAQSLTGSAVLAFVRSVLVAFGATASAAALVVGLYLMKSAAGINLLPWHSPLHDLLYHFVR